MSKGTGDRTHPNPRRYTRMGNEPKKPNGATIALVMLGITFLIGVIVGAAGCSLFMTLGA